MMLIITMVTIIIITMITAIIITMITVITVTMLTVQDDSRPAVVSRLPRCKNCYVGA